MSGESYSAAAIWATAAVVAATLLGPIFAVQIQKWLERSRALRDRQTFVFRMLMTQRLSLTVENVQAFNAVPIEFYGQEAILAAWRAYVAHMATPTDAPDGNTWQTKRIDLFHDLLQKMAVCLGYKFDFVQLKDDFYYPKGHSMVSTDQDIIRRGVADLFAGKTTLPLDVRQFPADPELNSLIKQWLKSQLPPAH